MELNVSNRLVDDDSNLTYCDNCDRLVETTYTVVTDWWRYGRTEQWCEECYDNHASECECCQTMFSNDYVQEYELWDGGYVTLCEDCRSDYYRQCDECGCLVPNDEAEQGDDGYWYCPDHIAGHRHSENINRYHQTTGEVFWLDSGVGVNRYDLTEEERNALYLGVELETDYANDLDAFADQLIEDWGRDRLELKEDGSLSDDGLEIVSQPMTPLYHLKSGIWESILNTAKSFDARSYDANHCGLHIHMSRDYFSSHDAVYRLDRLFHRFKNEFVRFSRRTDFYYCVLEDDDLHEIKSVSERKRVWERKKYDESRYHALNDKNPHTVEVRLWRGTLNEVTFRATIEMTAALAIVSNSMSDELADSLTWPMLKLLLRYALDANDIPRNDFDNYLTIRGL